jgi:hypothetical protein
LLSLSGRGASRGKSTGQKKLVVLVEREKGWRSPLRGARGGAHAFSTPKVSSRLAAHLFLPSRGRCCTERSTRLLRSTLRVRMAQHPFHSLDSRFSLPVYQFYLLRSHASPRSISISISRSPPSGARPQSSRVRLRSSRVRLRSSARLLLRFACGCSRPCRRRTRHLRSSVPAQFSSE